MTNAVAELGNTPEGALVGQGANPASSQDLVAANLAQHAVHARGAYSTNTERALRADVAAFTAWCVAAGLAALPAAPDTLVRYVDALAGRKAPATIRRYLSSIATFHRAARLDNPCTAIEVGLALKRLHREQGRAQMQAAPLIRPLVDRLLAAAVPDMKGRRDRALLALAYDTLCRRSELVALRVADIEAGTNDDATALVARSKTDQEGVGMVRYIAPDTRRHIEAWTAAAGITDGLLFRSVGRGGRVGGALDTGDVARIFKRMAKAAGISPDAVAGISGHSSRVGAAQDMVRHGVELPAVMQAGGWRTAEMVGRYTRRLDARRSGAAKLAILQNRT